jgi:hypothetical protein
MLYKWLTAKHSEGKLVTGPMIIEKANSFYDEMKITGKLIFSEGCKKNSLKVLYDNLEHLIIQHPGARCARVKQIYF